MKHKGNVAALFFAALLFGYAFWQLDLNAGGGGALAPLWNEPFGWALVGSRYEVVTTRGVAYDIQLSMIWVATGIIFCALWFWQDERVVVYEKMQPEESKQERTKGNLFVTETCAEIVFILKE